MIEKSCLYISDINLNPHTQNKRAKLFTMFVSRYKTLSIASELLIQTVFYYKDILVISLCTMFSV